MDIKVRGGGTNVRKLLTVIFVLGVVGFAVGYLNLPGPESGGEISREESLTEPAESSFESELPSLSSASPEPEVPNEEVASVDEASNGDPQAIILFTVTFRGTVLVGGTDEPVSGAEVYFDGLDERMASTTTDASGEFVLEVEVYADSIKYYDLINCQASGYPLNQKEIDLIGLAADGFRAELFTIFSLTPGQQVAGLIRDEESGEPIADASVAVYESEGDRFAGMGDALLIATSDAEGAYHFDTLAPGPYDFVVDGREQGYVHDASATRSANVEQGTDLFDFDFALNMGGVISGVVADPQGDPVVDAYIVLRPSEFDPTDIMENAFSRISDDGEPNSTDDTGHFEIKGVDFETSFIVSVLAEDYASSANGPIRVTKSHPTHEIEVVLSAGSHLSGLVRFEDGAPAQDYDVTLRIDSDAGFFAQMVGGEHTETNEQGAFTMKHVGAGDYTISAQNMNFEEEREISLSSMLPGGDDAVALSVDGINPVEGVVIVLANKPKGTGVIQGIVRLPDGTLASGVTVEASSSGGFMPGSRKAKTGTDGYFEIAGLLKSTYDLNVRERSGAVSLDDVTVGSTVALRMGLLMRLTGRVLDAEGKAVSDARLQLVDVDEAEGSNMFSRLTSFLQDDSGVRTDDMGYFEIERVEVGEYQIKAKSVSKGSATSERIVVAVGRSIPNIDIRLVAGVAFAGSVEDADGRPVKDSTVTLYVAPPDDEMSAMANVMPFVMMDEGGVATSDDDGAFRIPNVEDGGYIVVASADGYADTRLDGVEIAGPGDTSGFQVVLNRGGCVSGIARVDGQTKAGLMVQLVGASGNHTAMTDASGYYEICAIAAGSYMGMVIDMDNFSPTEMAGMRPNFVEVGDGESVTFNLVPPADGVSVSGVVAAPAGGMGFAMLMDLGAVSMSTIDPLDMEASMEMARGMVGQAMIGPDGSFDLGLIPPGTYQFQVYSMNLDLENLELENLEEMSAMVPEVSIQQEVTVVAGEPLFIDLSSL